MRVCRVKPDDNTCYACIDNRIDSNTFKNCKDCWEDPYEYEILQLGVTFFGKPYAFVLHDGYIKKVPLHRLYNVREAEQLCSRDIKKK